MSPKKRPTIFFRSLSLPPPPQIDSNEESAVSSVHSPHFLAALQVMTHVLAPLRKAMVHFYMTCRKRDVASLPLEWRTLMALGKLFQQAVAPSSGRGDASVSIATTASSTSSTSSKENNHVESEVALRNVPVSTEKLYPVMEECLTKYHKTTQPKDSTEALQLLLELIQVCTRKLPVTNQLWSAMLEQAGLGLIARQSLVGRKVNTGGEIVQRTKREMCMLWCPLQLPYYHPKIDEETETTLPQLFEQYCSRQPYVVHSNSNSKKKTKAKKDYYDFDKQTYDFEVKIPAFGQSSSTAESGKWNTTRSLQLTNLTAYLFLGIQRRKPLLSNELESTTMDNDNDDPNWNNAELLIPLTLDVSKLCDPNAIPKNVSKEYELVGGILFDEGDYVPVLRDENRVTPKKEENGNQEENNVDQEEEDDDDEAWKLLETEEVIPMSESDVVEFLKGEEDGDAPCGTMAIYRRVDKACHEEMNQLLSDIIISQVSGTLSSTADFYIEEEVIEDEEDDGDEETVDTKEVAGGADVVGQDLTSIGSMATIEE